MSSSNERPGSQPLQDPNPTSSANLPPTLWPLSPQQDEYQTLLPQTALNPDLAALSEQGLIIDPDGTTSIDPNLLHSPTYRAPSPDPNVIYRTPAEAIQALRDLDAAEMEGVALAAFEGRATTRGRSPQRTHAPNFPFNQYEPFPSLPATHTGIEGQSQSTQYYAILETQRPDGQDHPTRCGRCMAELRWGRTLPSKCQCCHGVNIGNDWAANERFRQAQPPTYEPGEVDQTRPYLRQSVRDRNVVQLSSESPDNATSPIRGNSVDERDASGVEDEEAGPQDEHQGKEFVEERSSPVVPPSASQNNNNTPTTCQTQIDNTVAMSDVPASQLHIIQVTFPLQTEAQGYAVTTTPQPHIIQATFPTGRETQNYPVATNSQPHIIQATFPTGREAQNYPVATNSQPHIIQATFPTGRDAQNYPVATNSQPHIIQATFTTQNYPETTAPLTTNQFPFLDNPYGDQLIFPPGLIEGSIDPFSQATAPIPPLEWPLPHQQQTFGPMRPATAPTHPHLYNDSRLGNIIGGPEWGNLPSEPFPPLNTNIEATGDFGALFRQIVDAPSSTDDGPKSPIGAPAQPLMPRVPAVSTIPITNPQRYSDPHPLIYDTDPEFWTLQLAPDPNIMRTTQTGTQFIGRSGRAEDEIQAFRRRTIPMLGFQPGGDPTRAFVLFDRRGQNPYPHLRTTPLPPLPPPPPPPPTTEEEEVRRRSPTKLRSRRRSPFLVPPRPRPPPPAPTGFRSLNEGRETRSERRARAMAEAEAEEAEEEAAAAAAAAARVAAGEEERRGRGRGGRRRGARGL